MQKFSLTLLFVAIFGFACFSLVKIIATGAPDFNVYYVSAQNLLVHTNIYTATNTFTGLGYPPMTLIVFLPLLLLPYGWAQAAWIVMSFGALLASIYVVLKLFHAVSIENYFIVFIFAFLSFPTRFTLGMGQSNLVALLFFCIALWAIAKKDTGTTTLGLSILSLLKPHLLLLSPLFIWHKKTKILVWVLLIVLIVSIVTGSMFGWENFTTYLSYMIPKLSAFRGREIYYNQGISAFASRALVYPFSQWLTTIASVLVITLTLWFIRKEKSSFLVSILISLPVVFMIEPLSWQHHYVFLLPTFVWVWINIKKDTESIVLFLASYFLVSMNIKTPSNAFGPIILSHALWGNILLYALALKTALAVQRK